MSWLSYLWLGLVLYSSAFVDENHPFYWKQPEKYYYDNIVTKMNEILIGDCKYTLKILSDNTIQIPSNASEFYVSSFPASAELHNWWLNIPRPIQHRVEPYFCDVVYTKKYPIFNKTGCQLPAYMNPSAPRCQTSYLKWLCEGSRMNIDQSTPNYFIIPESDHGNSAIPPIPWLLTAKDALVSICGQISGKCGILHTTANCMATGFRSQALSFARHCPLDWIEQAVNPGQGFGLVLNKTCNDKAPFGTEVFYFDKVFVVAEVDDTFVYHVHLEILPRIVYHLTFLLENPEVMILVGCDSKKGRHATEAGLTKGIQALKPMLEVLGISLNRLIVHKHVFAHQIFLPMEGGCQDPIYNTWQILKMRQLLLNKLGLLHKTQQTAKTQNPEKIINQEKSVMMLLKRSSNSKHTRNGHDLVRQWSDEFTQNLLEQLNFNFNSSYTIKLYSDKNDTLMKCFSCQIQRFAETNVLIGVHGAGLGNMLYMEPNSAVVEFAPYGNDGRCLLGGGPFSRLAALMSHNYMMHQPPYSEFKWVSKDMTSEFNITRFVIHIHSFLQSIGKF